MEKDPSAVILAMAFAFCVFCPFFVRCNENELKALKNGIGSLSNIMEKYQAEFDGKIKFVKLQKAIDEIENAMMKYQGKAKDKLPLVRSLNSDAKITYENCVAPVFEWCNSINGTFNIFIRMIGNKELSEIDRNMVWNTTVETLDSGLEKTAKSLDLLTNVQYKTAELKNQFKAMLSDIHTDFGPGGFYGTAKVENQGKIDDKQVLLKLHISSLIGHLFHTIGSLIFGPIGVALGIAISFATVYGIQELADWEQKETYKEKIEAIEQFFTVLAEKVEDATEIVKGIENALEEDKTNLLKLQGIIDGTNNINHFLLSDMAILRVELIPDILNLKNQCTKYVEWHGYDASFYQNIKSRTRRAASKFCEGQRLNAKVILA